MFGGWRHLRYCYMITSRKYSGVWLHPDPNKCFWHARLHIWIQYYPVIGHQPISGIRTYEHNTPLCTLKFKNVKILPQELRLEYCRTLDYSGRNMSIQRRCPGSLCHLVISHHGIDNWGWTFVFSMGIFTICSISVLKNIGIMFLNVLKWI